MRIEDWYEDPEFTDDALRVCEGDDCRWPRTGPFVVDESEFGARRLCLRCVWSDVFLMTPEDYPL